MPKRLREAITWRITRSCANEMIQNHKSEANRVPPMKAFCKRAGGRETRIYITSSGTSGYYRRPRY